jgi:hypothetical protein
MRGVAIPRRGIASIRRGRAGRPETLRRVYGDVPVHRALGRYARRCSDDMTGPSLALETTGGTGNQAAITLGFLWFRS